MEFGFSTTNEVPMVGRLRVASAANRVVNVTPSQPLVDLLISCGIVMASGAAGWMVRNRKLSPGDKVLPPK